MLVFDLDGRDSVGDAHLIRIQVDVPVCNADERRWECRISWAGAREDAVKIYGITSFQALRLALDFLEVEIPASLPGLTFRQDGLPWPTPRLF